MLLTVYFSNRIAELAYSSPYRLGIKLSLGNNNSYATLSRRLYSLYREIRPYAVIYMCLAHTARHSPDLYRGFPHMSHLLVHKLVTANCRSEYCGARKHRNIFYLDISQ